MSDMNGSKGAVIINGKYPPGGVFKGSENFWQIFGKKNKGCQNFRVKFKGSEIIFRF